ncbi:MAG: DUF4430 domain-containing protein [Theionarchaea archaeon]|nr:DUF4430 domain-containing protein [Theionarchaea archaeon]MBU7037798.1 DUF4430 domain-containing protein [Theionarchaea archaeon]
MKRKLIGIVLIVVAVSCLCLGQGEKGIGAGDLTETAYTVVVDTTLREDGSLIEYGGRVPSGSNIFDALTACGILYEEEGGFVTSINGIEQNPSENIYWIYYVNGELGQVGAADYVVEEGDEITWKLEKF